MMQQRNKSYDEFAREMLVQRGWSLDAVSEKALPIGEAFKKLTSAQVEYIDLMRKVNATLQKHLAGVER